MALSENLQMDVAQTYIVYRDIQAGEPFDPTSPVLFFPPKGSDELFDALRLAFPLIKTHSERMREAVIAFLMQERQEESLQASPAMTLDTAPSTWQSVSTSVSSSSFSSPELLTHPTPASFINSPQPQAPPHLSRQGSVAGSSQSSPPSLDQMTGVFSLTTAAQPKQRVRRKMTESEKAEYRKRRIVKACDKCAKRKRKCPHNQAEMESLPSSKSGSKIAKPVAAKSSKFSKSDKQMALPTEAMVARGNFASFATDVDPNFQSFEDFTMFDGPFSELDVDNFWTHGLTATDFAPIGNFTPDLSPAQQSWPSNHPHYEYSLLDSTPAYNLNFNDPALQDQNLDTFFGLDESQPDGRSQEDHSPHQQVSRVISSHLSMPERNPAKLPTSLRQQGGRQDDGSRDNGQGIPGRNDQPPNAKQQILSPTHTAHVHSNGQVMSPSDANGMMHETYRDKSIQRRGTAGGDQEPRTDQNLRLQTSTSVSSTSDQTPAPLPQGWQSKSSTLQKAYFKEQRCNVADQEIADHDKVMLSGANESRQRTSTSVSQSSGAKAAALPKGRPQPLPFFHSENGNKHNQATGPIESPRHFSTHARPMASLGGISASGSGRNSELYMLRRRLPTTTTGTLRASTGPLRNADNSAIAAQTSAHGGTYPRLKHIANDHHDVRFPGTDKGHAAAFAVRDACVIDAAMASLGNFTYAGKLPQTDRLRDYNKFKDHHGRSSSAASILFGVLMLATLFAANHVSVSMVLLAGFALLRFGRSAGRAEGQHSLVQGTEKNSSRLARQLERVVKAGKHRDSSEASMKGLMFPFASQPLRLAFV